MTRLEVTNLPEQTLAALKTRARRNRRSLNREILSIFDWVTLHDIGKTAPAPEPADPLVLRQKREMEELIGTWDDSRTAGEIIADIENARTDGRKVAL